MKQGYYPIFSLVTVIIAWLMGIGMGMTFIELSIKKTVYGLIFFLPMFALFSFLLIRDERAYWMRQINESERKPR